MNIPPKLAFIFTVISAAVMFSDGFAHAISPWNPLQPESSSDRPTASHATNDAAARSRTTDDQTQQDTQKKTSNARTSELMAFLKRHHPEIRPLLNTLKKTRPKQFSKAMKGLDREVRSLQSQKERSPERYKQSIAMWIARSKIKLLSAQLAVKKTDEEQQEIRHQIRALIDEHADMRTQQISSDIQSTESRLARLKEQLSKLSSNRDSNNDRQMDSINRSAKRNRDAQEKGNQKTKRKTGKTNPDKGKQS